MQHVHRLLERAFGNQLACRASSCQYLINFDGPVTEKDLLNEISPQ